MSPSAQETAAIRAAQEAQQYAHAPYSGKKLGAAILTPGGEWYAGCNVENASSDLRVCAERNAIARAIVSGASQIETVIVVAPDDRFWPPCDLCRGVITEFAPDPIVIMITSTGRFHSAKLSTLPRIPFSSDGSVA